ncbi:hypothetical protein SAMN02910298_02531 [Pseudobutyrivibrio sp. YE44]|nr:hypothetical protein SAMN02910298_02531 [Pseudobutyrivibrio sp. YE44]
MGRYKDLPNSHVYISNSNGCPQYYLKNEGAPRQYVRKKDIKHITRFAQRDYEEDMNRKLKLLERNLADFLELYDVNVVNAYDRFDDSKKHIIKPLIETDGQFIDKWYDEHPGECNQYPKDEELKTNRGEIVRSKSEKIIADALDKYGVPYRYEPLLELGYSTIYPDFVILNTRTRKTLYWEHLGIISDIDYATKNLRKIRDYEKQGFLLGRDLILTMEESDKIIDVNLVEQKIKEFLL